MTTQEFKKIHPEFAHLEGDALWNAMEESMLRQQEGDAIIKSVIPARKKYQLRWLFYRRLPNMVWSASKYDKYIAHDRCKACKWGVNGRLVFIMWDKNGIPTSYSNCPQCGKEYKAEPNTNYSYRAYKISKRISKGFWDVLDWLHLVRSAHSGRYDIFGDEGYYVTGWELNTKTGVVITHFKKRKWWEYILIEKR